MPTPQRLTGTIVFDFDGIRLSPPYAQAMVTPTEAWSETVARGASSYRLVLAHWTSTVPPGPFGPTDALMWVILGSHVAFADLGPGQHPPIYHETAMWLVDATSGQAFTGEYGFGAYEVASLKNELRPYRSP